LHIDFLSLTDAKQLHPHQLIGSWSLLNCVVRFSDGRPEVFPFGTKAIGQLAYLSDGWMSATLSEPVRVGHDQVRLESARKASVEERARAYDSYMAYAGRWTVEELKVEALENTTKEWGRRGKVIHQVILALTPNTMGESNVRYAHLVDNQLTLRYSYTPKSGVRRDYELIWQKEPNVLEATLLTRTDRQSVANLWLHKHQQTLAKAITVTRERSAWTPFIESPSRTLHPEGAKELGLKRFESHLNQKFELNEHIENHPSNQWLGGEVSPYTLTPLGIEYETVDVDQLFDAMSKAWSAWRWVTYQQRAGICLEILDRWAHASFEIAYATMHTAGQGFMLAFSGSGASSLDRGLEALASAWIALESIPQDAQYSRTFGKAEPAQLKKRYYHVPVGAAVVFSCGSYPAWNAYPAIMANLVTGNPVVVKPHPNTILPVAIAVKIARETLKEAGFSPNLITLAPDTWQTPIGLKLLNHPLSKIIDFTGGQRFGRELESKYSHLQVYTETSGCNAVILESSNDLNATLDALAQGLCLFSAQMCTAPQNLWISETGFKVYETGDHGERIVTHTLTPQAFTQALIDRIDQLLSNPKVAAGVCGALHSPNTLKEIQDVTAEVLTAGGTVLRRPQAYAHPDFAKARTATPLICMLNTDRRAPAQSERFGPISFVIKSKTVSEMIRAAAQDASEFGAIASYAYSVDPHLCDDIERQFIEAGASIGFNLHKQSPMNFTAAFSDFHVTGLNPAGSASLTDLAFVSQRFRVVQSKREV